MLQSQYRQIRRNSTLKPRLYIGVYKNLDPSPANLTIKVEMFKPLLKVRSRICSCFMRIELLFLL